MKGIIFNILQHMVEEHNGITGWDKLLEQVCPASGGAYTSAATYDDRELFQLVERLSLHTGIPALTLVRSFGEYALLYLSQRYPTLFAGHTAKSFLQSIDQVVHVEVRKLHPDAGLPTFRYEDPSPQQLVMLYESPRKLCTLAAGLIDGTARYYQTPIAQQHTQCILHGAPHCRFELTFGEPIRSGHESA